MFIVTYCQGNANQIEMRYHLTPVRRAERLGATSVGKDIMEKRPHSLLVGMLLDSASMETRMENPQKGRIQLPYDPVIPLVICPNITLA